MAPLFTGSRMAFGAALLLVPTYSISASTTSVNEGSSVTFTVTTTDVDNGTTLYWSTNQVSGTINTSDFNDSATTGSFTISGNSGTITRTLANDFATEGSESFQLQIRTGSTSGTIVATSATVTISDTSTAVTYTGMNLGNATNTVCGDANNGYNGTGTATFTPGIAYNSLTVYYGNMANGNLGNPASGATLYINGSPVGATGTTSACGYNPSYTKYYTTNTPGTLNSIGVSPPQSGSHDSNIFEIIINGSNGGNGLSNYVYVA
jgi:hypothetical protein